jgi:acyl-CoA reductase-like NAD-dependent aldehyde dehydrogenase
MIAPGDDDKNEEQSGNQMNGGNGQQVAQPPRAASERDVKDAERKAEEAQRYAVEEVESLREQVNELREENRALATALIEVDESLGDAFDVVKTRKIGHKMEWTPEVEERDGVPERQTDSGAEE